ncbi:ABC transporter permease [Xylanimonas sp. McL0601]|uniref:ABC transporter permease n=1 Tax=Xylanimonas sp. McL0601 TaxID=3414739 RepID=UPI003CF4CD6C
MTTPAVTTQTDVSVVPADDSPVGAPRRRRNETLYFALRNPKVVGAVLVVGVMLVAGIVGPYLVPYSPTERIIGATMLPPSSEHWFGTTMQGEDVFSQFIFGLRSTFLVGILGGGIAAVVGMTIGFIAGYRGGLLDELLNMLTNIVLVIPGFVVLIIINAYLGVRSLPMQALFIGLSSWPWVARAVRAQTLSLRARDFIDLARMSGQGTGSIIRREIAPNMYSYLFMTFVLLFGGAVLTAAALDFIGLGPTGTGVMSLGLMMNQAVQWSALTLELWWWFVVPGAGITLIVGSLYVMNVGLDEVFNPKLREM